MAYLMDHHRTGIVSAVFTEVDGGRVTSSDGPAVENSRNRGIRHGWDFDGQTVATEEAGGTGLRSFKFPQRIGSVSLTGCENEIDGNADADATVLPPDLIVSPVILVSVRSGTENAPGLIDVAPDIIPDLPIIETGPEKTADHRKIPVIHLSRESALIPERGPGVVVIVITLDLPAGFHNVIETLDEIHNVHEIRSIGIVHRGQCRERQEKE